MIITDVRLTKLTDSKALALASITIDTDFVVSGLTVYNGQNGMWVSMPSRKNKDNEFKDIAFPITKEARQTIQDSVLNKFNELTEPHMPIPEKNDRQKEYDNNEDDNSDSLPF